MRRDTAVELKMLATLKARAETGFLPGSSPSRNHALVGGLAVLLLITFLFHSLWLRDGTL
jgi:hypothetical protein